LPRVVKLSPAPAQKIAADVNGDGKVDTVDAREILQLTVDS